MTRYIEQRKQSQDWQRQGKSSVAGDFSPRQHAFRTVRVSLTTPLNTQCSIPPHPTHTPKTPPTYQSSLRRENRIMNPISPPNPLRLASTNETCYLPRPESSSLYQRYGPPPICYQYIGDPSLGVFKVKLPSHLMNGSLDAIVSGAEKHVGSLKSGWKTELYSLTKCDIACKDVPNIDIYVKPISMYINFVIQTLYGYRKIIVDQNQPHILKYSARDGYTGVQLHHDRCDVTANLALSRRNTYIGGGTYIAAIKQVIRLEQGEFLLHPGCLVHSGHPITAGTRYLLVTFADLQW